MSLRSSLRAATNHALAAMDSVAQPATYVSTGPLGTYDPVTGTAPATQDASAAIRVFLVSRVERELDQPFQVTPNTKRAIFNRDGFPFEAKAEDKITLPASAGDDAGTWEVVRTLSEPSASVYVLEVRRP